MKNKGIIHLGALIGIFVVLFGVSIYWYLRNNEKLRMMNYELSDTSDWKTYRNEKYGFEFNPIGVFNSENNKFGHIVIEYSKEGNLVAKGDTLYAYKVDGMDMANIGEFEGILEMTKDGMFYKDEYCLVDMEFIDSDRIKVVDNLGCGGLNVTFAGIYKRESI